MNQQVIALSLGGNIVKYRIEPMPQQVDLKDARCPRCGHTIELIAEMLQWGFWEDSHYYFVICQKCAATTCYKQEIVLDWEVEKNEQH